MRARFDDVRRWHYIPKNARTSIPANLLFFDTETEPVPVPGSANKKLHILRLWTAISCRIERGEVSRVKRFSGTRSEHFWTLVDSLVRARNPLYAFAHNAGFDLTVLKFWQELEEGRYTFSLDSSRSRKDGRESSHKARSSLVVIDDPPTILQVFRTDNRGQAVFLDSYNYFASSVAELGDSLGIPKLPMPAHGASRQDWEHYSYRDCEIVQKAITGLMVFVKENDLGSFRYTAPAQAFAAYRHRFMDAKILCHGNKDVLKLEREAYYGGRCQQFFAGKIVPYDQSVNEFFGMDQREHLPTKLGPVYVLDANSFYPSMMRWRKYPAKLLGTIANPSMESFEYMIMEGCIIARVLIDSDTHSFPVHRDGRTFNAVGRYVTTLCGPELQWAWKARAIRAVGLVAEYEAEYLFADYVEFFWKMRNEYKASGNKVYSHLCKILLNTLFGKFGQRGKHWVTRNDVFAPVPWGSWSEFDELEQCPATRRSLAWLVQQEHTGGESSHSCPSIAAFVTSYGRSQLAEWINIAGEANVYYTDTDSIHCNMEGYANLRARHMIGTDGLGELSVRGIYESAEYRGLKDYTIGDCHVIAGIRRNAKRVRKGVFVQDDFQGLRSVLAGPPPDGIQVTEMTVDRSQAIPLGIISPNGRIRPPVLREYLTNPD